MQTHVPTGSFEDLHNQNVFREINVQNRAETDSSLFFFFFTSGHREVKSKEKNEQNFYDFILAIVASKGLICP